MTSRATEKVMGWCRAISCLSLWLLGIYGRRGGGRTFFFAFKFAFSFALSFVKVVCCKSCLV